MSTPLQIISRACLDAYKTNFDPVLMQHYDLLEESGMSLPGCNLSQAVAAVYSSALEGDIIEFGDYVSHRLHTIDNPSDVNLKIDLVYDAYEFAKSTKLSAISLVDSHTILVKHMEDSSYAYFRTHTLEVRDPGGHMLYGAAMPNQIFSEMMKYYVDLDQLLNEELDFAEAFYYAAMLHLVLIRIQPFAVGNGMLARLAEKWFLAEKLGPKAWFIFSENYYFDYSSMYRILLEKVGPDYKSLDYKESLYFLTMLHDAVKFNL